MSEPVAWRWGIRGLKGYIHWRYSLHKTKDHAQPLYIVPPLLKYVPEEDVNIIIENMFRFRQDFNFQQLRYFAKTIQSTMEKINRG